MRQPCLYIPASKRNGTLYVGATSDIATRVWQHRSGAVEGFTRQYRVHRLVQSAIRSDRIDLIGESPSRIM
ncbi:GIY-YIG catalytic domain-containing protein [Tistlia consotensis]|uniref:Putative endonuclease n=1 Tax=Tistlia consotensis USBA 355 TaxID=560819 RepID=A0A1Y6BV19_9PROT|nr:GIY-YIG nuclease family protein [Tistlia consotensis]SMF29921.1 putative endonuclease [Tistlia consotensis USBA 355]SNR90655.1 GIY-YIG catalytic domain-containing protein [Tistlia consotensis]